MLGAIMIGTLEQSLFRLGISEFWRDAMLGLLILLAVASDAVILQRLSALWARTELKRARWPRRAARHDALSGSALGDAAVRRAAGGRGVQRDGVAILSRRRKHRQSVPALDRKDHRRADDDVGHHQRRDRSFGRLGDGPFRLRHGVLRSNRARRCRWRLFWRWRRACWRGSTTGSGSPMSGCRRSR